MAGASSQTQVGATPAEPVATCHACRYDIRGLDIDALCPECAAPVRDSLMSPLRLADTESVANLQAAARRLAAGLGLMGILLAVAAIVATTSLSVSRTTRDVGSPLQAIAWLWTIVMIAPVAMIGNGLMGFAKPIRSRWPLPPTRAHGAVFLGVAALVTSAFVILAFAVTGPFRLGWGFTSMFAVSALLPLIAALALLPSLRVVAWMLHRDYDASVRHIRASAIMLCGIVPLCAILLPVTIGLVLAGMSLVSVSSAGRLVLVSSPAVACVLVPVVMLWRTYRQFDRVLEAELDARFGWGTHVRQ
ncbi:MAG TPA: hypothetical protein VK157_12900 [Phycisphaerales bacterium]|nr:hypothetical protein [Phycisphaerales bacterium]